MDSKSTQTPTIEKHIETEKKEKKKKKKKNFEETV